MGNKRNIYRKNLSRKKGWVKRRMQMKLAKSMQIIHDAENKSTSHWSSINTMMINRLQMNEEQADNNVEYNEEGAHNETIEYCEDNKDFVFIDIDNIKQTEGYNEGDARNETIEYCEDNKDFVFANIDKNEKQTEKYNEEGACNETIEYCEDNKDLISVNIDNNVKQTEGYNEGGTHNETIEYCEDNKDFVFANIDNNGKQTEKYNEEGVCNEIIEYCEDNKDSVSVNIYNVKRTEGYKKGTHIQNMEYSIEKNVDNNCFENLFNHHIYEKIPTGRCIVDISFIWNEFHKIFTNHARGIDCQFKYWKLVNYRRRGLLTQFFFKCQMCRYEGSTWSEPIGTSKPDINAAVVAASVARRNGKKTEMGYSQLQKLFASMDIFFMSNSTYIKHRRNLNIVQKDATKNIIEK